MTEPLNRCGWKTRKITSPSVTKDQVGADNATCCTREVEFGISANQKVTPLPTSHPLIVTQTNVARLFEIVSTSSFSFRGARILQPLAMAIRLSATSRKEVFGLSTYAGAPFDPTQQWNVFIGSICWFYRGHGVNSHDYILFAFIAQGLGLGSREFVVIGWKDLNVM